MLKERAETQITLTPILATDRPQQHPLPAPAEHRAPGAAPEPSRQLPARHSSWAPAWLPAPGKYRHVVHAGLAGAAAALWVTLRFQSVGCVLPAGCSPGAQPPLIYSASLLLSLPMLFSDCSPGQELLSVLQSCFYRPFLRVSSPIFGSVRTYHPPHCETETSWLQGQTHGQKCLLLTFHLQCLSKARGRSQVSFCRCPELTLLPTDPTWKNTADGSDY